MSDGDITDGDDTDTDGDGGFIFLSQIKSVYLFRHFYTVNTCE